MNIEEQLRALCDQFDAQQLPVTTDEIIEAWLPQESTVGTEPDRGGRRLALVLAIAATIVVVVAGWLMVSDEDTLQLVPADPPINSVPSSTIGRVTPNTTTPTASPVTPSALPGFPTSVPDAPSDSMTPLSIATVAQRDGVLGYVAPTGEFVPTPDKFALPDGVLGEQRILDTASPGGGFYLIVCCDPGPALWRNGQLLPVTATRMQYAEAKSRYVLVDDVGDTLSVSGEQPNDHDPTISVPDIVDATGTSEGVVALVAGEDPHLLAYDWSPTKPPIDETASERFEVSFADQGPCSIVPVNDDLLVLYGTSDGIDRCIGDRAALIDGATGNLVNAIRLPGMSRQLNSAGNVVTVVTTDGRVLAGWFSIEDPTERLSALPEPSGQPLDDPPSQPALTPSSEPRWRTVVQADAVAASVGFS